MSGLLQHDLLLSNPSVPSKSRWLQEENAEMEKETSGGIGHMRGKSLGCGGAGAMF
jgi:hypothetical protein